MSFLSDVIQILKSSGGVTSMTKEAMNCHASCYRENLQRCSEPMLQYEWAWLKQQLDVLRRSRFQPQMLHSLGGEEPMRILTSECVLFQLILQQEFARRQLTPHPCPASIVPSEEAWEITSQQVKEEWGIVPA